MILYPYRSESVF